MMRSSASPGAPSPNTPPPTPPSWCPKPAGLSFEQAAAMPMAAVTALHAIRDRGHVQPGPAGPGERCRRRGRDVRRPDRGRARCRGHRSVQRPEHRHGAVARRHPRGRLRVGRLRRRDNSVRRHPGQRRKPEHPGSPPRRHPGRDRDRQRGRIARPHHRRGRQHPPRGRRQPVRPSADHDGPDHPGAGTTCSP